MDSPASALAQENAEVAASASARDGEGEGDTLWDQMGRREMRAAAHAAGMTIGDYEAQQQLLAALQESATDGAAAAGGGARLPSPVHPAAAAAAVAAAAAAAAADTALQSAEDADDGGDGDAAEDDALSESGRSDAMSLSEGGAEGSDAAAAAAAAAAATEAEEDFDIVLQLDDDALRRIMLFLEPECVARCAAVSRHWSFARDERVFEQLCRRVYAAQVARGAGLNVARWRSWRRMIAHRPRVRTGGIYVLRHSHIKTPQIDMFTEWKRGMLLECVYYRALRFRAGGACSYCLISDGGPREAAQLLCGSSGGAPGVAASRHVSVHDGDYVVRRGEVTVTVRAAHAAIVFRLTLRSAAGRGAFTQADIVEHYSVSARDPRAAPCAHRVNPSEPFIFTAV